MFLAIKILGFLSVFLGLIMMLLSPLLGVIVFAIGLYLIYYKKLNKKYRAKKDEQLATSQLYEEKNSEIISQKKAQTKKLYTYTKVKKLVDDVIVLDFETTGFSPTDDEIIQVGAIKYINGRPIDEFVSYANPSKSISSRITKITGITNEIVQNAPPLKNTLIELNRFISDNTIVAHNASFDINFLIENYERYNIDYDNLKVIDTLSLARKYINDTDNHKLVTLKEYLEIKAESHDALEDCKVTGALYYYCKDLEENRPGNYKGKHYTEYKDLVVKMKREKKNIETINLLLNLVSAVEAEAKFKNRGPAPWYYEQLAILYRKEKQNNNEIIILKRYFDTCKAYGVPNGAKHPKLVERYSKIIKTVSQSTGVMND